MSLNLPLAALAVGAFGIGTTEFAPMGLLPVIAADLHVSIPTAGLLVTGYALGVAVSEKLVEHVPVRFQTVSPRIGFKYLLLFGDIVIGPGFHQAWNRLPPASPPMAKITNPNSRRRWIACKRRSPAATRIKSGVVRRPPWRASRGARKESGKTLN